MNQREDLVLLATGLSAYNSTLMIDRRSGRDRRGQGNASGRAEEKPRRFQFRSFDDRRQQGLTGRNAPVCRLARQEDPENDKPHAGMNGELVQALYLLLDHLRGRGRLSRLG